MGHCRGTAGFCNFYIFVFWFVWEIAVRGRVSKLLYFFRFVLEIVVEGRGFATFVFLFFFGLFGKLSWEDGVLQLLYFCFSVC